MLLLLFRSKCLLVDLSSFCMMMFWASFHPWDEKYTFHLCQLLIYYLSSPNPPSFFLFCNTGDGLMGCISLLPAGLMLHFDNRSVGGTMQGWKRKRGLFLLPVFCFSVQQEADQYAGTPTVFTATAGYPLWLNHGCPPASFLIAVLQAACSCDNWKLSSEV